MVLGCFLLIPDSNNVFIIKAYALEQQPDGSIGLCEVDLVNRLTLWEAISTAKCFLSALA